MLPRGSAKRASETGGANEADDDGTAFEGEIVSILHCILGQRNVDIVIMAEG
jgi:hypothetical protein